MYEKLLNLIKVREKDLILLCDCSSEFAEILIRSFRPSIKIEKSHLLDSEIEDRSKKYDLLVLENHKINGTLVLNQLDRVKKVLNQEGQFILIQLVSDRESFREKYLRAARVAFNMNQEEIQEYEDSGILKCLETMFKKVQTYSLEERRLFTTPSEVALWLKPLFEEECRAKNISLEETGKYIQDLAWSDFDYLGNIVESLKIVVYSCSELR